jgi:arginase
MNGVRLIQVPYHLGREGELIGAGPPVLADAIGGESVVVRRPGEFRNEIVDTFAIAHELARVVGQALEDGAFPLVLGGNCSTALGTVTGLDRDVGVIWFDAHGDLHTPDTTPTGFLEGMALALLIGQGWAELRGDFRVVPPERVLLVGARDFEPTEPIDAVTRVDAGSLQDALGGLDADAVYVHVDLDVLDPSAGRASNWSVGGGLGPEELEADLDAIASRFEIPAAAITAYDPRVDPEGRIPPIAARLASRLAAAGARA